MRTILITGATSGIGEATARAYAGDASAARPLHLMLVGRRADRLERLRSQLASDAVQVQIFALDVREPEAAENLARCLTSSGFRLDILVNNAGLAAGRDPFYASRLMDAEQMIDTNVKGLIYVTRALLPAMVERRKGHIVNIGSVAGRYTYPHGAVYCATKFAVGAFTEGLRLDLNGTGIRVTNIEPGMVDTEFSLVRFKGDERSAKAVYQGMTPLRAEDIASAIVWATNQPPHVNIQELLIMPTDQAGVRDVARTST